MKNWYKTCQSEQNAGDISDLIEETHSLEEIITLLQQRAPNVSYQKVDFANGPVLVLTFGNSSDYRAPRYVIDDFDNPSLEDATSWVSQIYDHNLDSYLTMPEEKFWENIGSSYIVYHATQEQFKDDILKHGLQPKNESRGISNRGTPAAVFASDDPEQVASYGTLVFAIDMGKMKADGYMPPVNQEEPYAEAMQREAIGSRIGLIDYHPDDELYSEGIWASTVVIFGPIPPKYLTVYRE